MWSNALADWLLDNRDDERMKSELLGKWQHCMHETTGICFSQDALATVIAPPVPGMEPEPTAVTVVPEELAAGQPEAAAASNASGPVTYCRTECNLC